MSGALVPVAWSENQVALIRRTVAADCNAPEFDQFIHICKHTGLDPLRRQIYAFVFGKNDADKRRLTVVTGIDGYRAISSRSADYRPDDQAPVIEYDKDAKNPDTNPLGIVRATVTLYKFVKDGWHPVVGEAYWDEFAPIIVEPSEGFDWVETGDFWPDSGKPKKKKVPREGSTMAPKLDPSKTGWIKSPRNQIAKCAEAQAHRKGWPNDYGGIYLQEEVDRSHSIDLSASEMADLADQTKRLEAIGGINAITVDWMTGAPLQRVPVGKFGDEAMEYLQLHMDKPAEILKWRDRNRHSLKEFWALDKAAALAIKAETEKAEKLAEQDAKSKPGKLAAKQAREVTR